MRTKKEHISLDGKNILVTGSPGFIGANLVMRLLTDSSLMKSGTIVSVDNMNDYYDPSLNEYRLSRINMLKRAGGVDHEYINANIADRSLVDQVFNKCVISDAHNDLKENKTVMKSVSGFMRREYV